MEPTPRRSGVSIGSYRLFDMLGRTTGDVIIVVKRMQVGQGTAESSWHPYDDWSRNSQHFETRYRNIGAVAEANSHHFGSSWLFCCEFNSGERERSASAVPACGRRLDAGVRRWATDHG
jgi:hypothetical protein